MNISNIAIAVEIDGKAHFVLLPKGTEQLVLKMIAGLSDNSTLNVAPAPDEFKFSYIGGLDSVIIE